ncbi:MAG: tetratricopeptide repeat protein [Desulfovibrionaceae bacterium]|nr:tetratricopeptide repeat protein [Desulfovibrionaceae bacterium]
MTTSKKELSEPTALRAVKPGSIPGTALLSRDLIKYELQLKEYLARFITFNAHSLYFPTTAPAPGPKWLPEEQKLLLPLIHNGALLGVFSAGGAEIEDEQQIHLLEKVAELCLDNLALFKAGMIDSSSGLYRKDCLLEHIAAGIESLQNSLLTGAGASPALSCPPCSELPKSGMNNFENFISPYPAANFAVLSANFSPLTRVAREYGHSFAEKFIEELARTFRECLPEHALPARVGDCAFAAYLPGKSPSDCTALGREICEKMMGVQLTDPLTRSIVSLPVAVGFACYPQDMNFASTVRVSQNGLEQAGHILEKAGMAAMRAWDSTLHYGEQIHLLGFGEILNNGGKVVGVLPMYRVELNVGSATGAREGMRFKVISPPAGPGMVGEIVISSVQKNRAIAEVTGLSDPTRPLSPGDRLELLPDFDLEPLSELDAAGEEPLSAFLLGHRAFLSRFAESREACSRFCLSLIRFIPGETLNPEQGSITEETIISRAQGKLVEKSACLLENGAFIGKYGMHSLILFSPDAAASELTEHLKGAAAAIEEEFGVELVAGTAAYPWLNYRKPDALTNAGKALDFALLLNKPRIGEANSLALNIRADRHFSHGDIFEAIREYKQALLADEENVWAWTSLGVCLAGIGSREEALRAFESALKINPADLMALYNLAQANQAEGDWAQARAYYRRCLEIDDGHAFSLLRLGQIAENLGEMQEAEKHYRQAAQYPLGEGPAYRQLARMALAGGRPDTAREHLHRTLAKNPNDPFALSMLAEIYLNNGDNPEIALSLMRQSVALRPEHAPGWLALAKACAACGLEEQAEQARLRAAEL